MCMTVVVLWSVLSLSCFVFGCHYVVRSEISISKYWEILCKMKIFYVELRLF
jgi:hypothetical protein